MAEQRYLTTTDFARVIGVETAYIRQLTQRGILRRARDAEGKELMGRYSLLSVRDYCEHLRASLRIDDASQLRRDALRNEKLAAETETAQIELKQRKGKLHEDVDVEFYMTQMLTAFKSRVLAIPQRCARRCVGKPFRQILEIIKSEIHLCLRELSGYDRSKFAAANREHLADKGVDLFVIDEEGGSNGADAK